MCGKDNDPMRFVLFCFFNGKKNQKVVKIKIKISFFFGNEGGKDELINNNLKITKK